MTHGLFPVQVDPVAPDPVEEQLRRMESRLLAEVDGDAVALLAVRSHLAAARARFAGATVRHFLPILVEREARRRIREDVGPDRDGCGATPSDAGATGAAGS